jgi:hypothetical protein
VLQRLYRQIILHIAGVQRCGWLEQQDVNFFFGDRAMLNAAAWVLAKPKYLKRPVPYDHTSAVVIWVTLDRSTEQRMQPEIG